MNFGEEQCVWLVDDQGNRFAAVAFESSNGPASCTFTFYYDERIRSQIERYRGRPGPEPTEVGLLEGDINELDDLLNELWGFDKIPQSENMPCYAIMRTRSRENGAYINEQGQWRYADTGLEPHPPDDFDCIWDGFKVEPRE